MGTLAPRLGHGKFTFKPVPRKSLGYSALVLFTFLYYWRPEDFVPGLAWVPMAKISGGIAVLALILGVRPSDRQKLPLEIKVLLLLLLDLIITIPFAVWRGGAFQTVVNRFSKAVIVALLVSLMVTQVSQMRRLLAVQVGAVAFVAFASLIAHRTIDGRLWGISKSIMENPNDLAIEIAMNFPLCLAFLLAAKGVLRKLVWSSSMLVMLLVVVLTYSRSGAIAMTITALGCIWEFGIKGKRRFVLVGAIAIAVAGVVVVAVTPHYLTRLHSVVSGNIEGSGDKGSLEARKELLMESVSTALHHPIFGVGPGNFEVVNGMWRVAHNSYTELAAEAGFPALALFLLLLGLSFRKIGRVRKLPGYKADENIRLWTSALWTGLAGYACGSMFASTEYNLFPYFMVGYISALYQIATIAEPRGNLLDEKGRGNDESRSYGGNRKLEPAWSR